jgi:hypothetical protein
LPPEQCRLAVREQLDTARVAELPPLVAELLAEAVEPSAITQQLTERGIPGKQAATLVAETKLRALADAMWILHRARGSVTWFSMRRNARRAMLALQQ